jgi:hypothetical protein
LFVFSEKTIMTRLPDAEQSSCTAGQGWVRWRVRHLVVALVLLLLFTSIGWAATGFTGLALTWSMIGSGGDQSRGGSYGLVGSIGQPVAGESMQGGRFGLSGVFGQIGVPQTTPTATVTKTPTVTPTATIEGSRIYLPSLKKE